MKTNSIHKYILLTSYFAWISLLFLFFLVGIGISHTVKNNHYELVKDLSHVWSDQSGKSLELNQFALSQATDSSGQKVYYTLPDIQNNYILMFRCRNLFVNVYLDNQLIYEDNKSLHTIYGTSPGSRWHTIALDSSSDGKTLCLEGFACYQDTNGLIDNIHLGSAKDVYRVTITQHFMSFFISLILLTLGVLLIIICIGFRKNRSIFWDLLYLGVGVIIASSWAISESLLCQLFIAHAEVMHLVTYTSLIGIPLCFGILALHRLSGIYKSFCLWYTILCSINALVTTTLHLTGIREYHYTLSFTRILLVILVPLLLKILLSYANYDSEKKKLKSKYILIPALTIVTVCILVALIEFWFGWFYDYSKYIRIAMVSFMACLVYYQMQQVINILQKGMEADVLHKLALTDHLTGLYNRTAFAEHSEKYLENMIKHSVLGVIQFDVNNLKTVNDTLGHEKGDQLIQLVAEGLQTSFSDTGNCYRMGGDEFLVILTGDNPQNDYEIGIRLLHTYCAAHNTQPDIDFSIQIAHGFVLGQNGTLSEAMEKADIRMYENKKQLKSQSNTK